MSVFIKGLRQLAFGNLIIALAAACQTALSCQLLQVPLRFPLLLFAFCGTLFIYHSATALNPQANHFEPLTMRERWISRNKVLIRIYMAVGLSGMLYSVFFLHTWSIIVLLFLGLISVFYNYPVPVPHRMIRFRNIPGLKLILIAFVWTGTTVWIPFLESGSTDIYFFSALSLQRFFFLIALTIPFDIRDLSLDQQQSIRTIPSMVGVNAAKYLSLAFLLLSEGTILIMDRLHPSGVSVSLSITNLVTLVLISTKKIKKDDMYYLVYLDGMLILSFLINELMFN